jgi:hypothetical protein
MDRSVECPVHGKSQPTYVCIHLTGNQFGLGFNRNDPSEDEPFPDAWCDDCELIRVQQAGWTEESEKLAQITLLCAQCYERARIRNTRTSTSLDDLTDLRWKCGSCDEWHTGPCLDFSYGAPIHWTDEHERENDKSSLLPSWIGKKRKTFLNEDFCVIDDEHFFIRGLLNLPIIGTDQNFGWGLWGSLSRENFKKVLAMYDDSERAKLLPMFSWLSNEIPEYPTTLNLKMYVHVQKPGCRPLFELEPTNHPLSQEYQNGISSERVREIMLGRLGSNNARA